MKHISIITCVVISENPVADVRSLDHRNGYDDVLSYSVISLGGESLTYEDYVGEKVREAAQENYDEIFGEK